MMVRRMDLLHHTESVNTARDIFGAGRMESFYTNVGR
jgi:hypothetical protein